MSLGSVRARPVVLGFAVAGVLLGALLVVVGVDDVAAAMSGARPLPMVTAAGVVVLWLLAWAATFRVVLDAMAVRYTGRETLLGYLTLVFANNVLPIALLGGEALTALAIARATGGRFESTLAALASVDAINYLPVPTLAVFGLAYFGATAVLGRPGPAVAGVLLAVGLGVLGLSVVAWRYRDRLREAAVVGVTGVLGGIGRVVPGLTPPTARVVHDGVTAFGRSVVRVASDRPRLALALALGLSGWLLQGAALWLSLSALDHVVPAAVALFVVPLAAVADVVPVPGGLGGVEATLVFLIVTTTGIPVADATAATLLYRVVTYWLPTLVGGAAAAVLTDTPAAEPAG
ncbi:YbhN family protein [Halobacteriaceae archaeon GCM10025711]